MLLLPVLAAVVAAAAAATAVKQQLSNFHNYEQWPIFWHARKARKIF